LGLPRIDIRKMKSIYSLYDWHHLRGSPGVVIA
jgi:hypothetical protein